MVSRHVVGAGYGLRDWIMQRITAVIMVIYTVALVVFVFTMPSSYKAWQAMFKTTWVQLFTQVTLIALFLHVWVGIRDVWMDYIKCVCFRIILHVLTILWLLSCCIYSIKIIWGL